jgi:hypothetical protein
VVEEVEAARQAVVLAARQVVVLAARQAVVLVAQEVVPVGQAVLEEADLVQVSTWEEILVVAEQMEDSKATCPRYLTGTVQKATSFCGNSAF